ncbi:MAG TPA: YidC/Oxa1 family membrane protein insertase [Chloroflexota bacterium]
MQIFNVFLPFQDLLRWLITSLTDATLSYGLAIILFTIIIRGILAPLYVIQIRSSRKMTELGPKIKELQKRHAKDRESLTRETMALYKEHNHNPALGCLLPFIQIPILWSLFLVLRSLAQNASVLKAEGLAHYQLYSAHFLWLDLGKPDAYHILPIVAGITQWIQQRMMLQPTSDPQQRQMQQIMQFLPLMIVVFAWQYPSGLAVYWVTSNIIMMIMQYLISGWGSLWTSPMSIPMPGDVAPSYSPAANLARGGMARAFTSRQSAATNGANTSTGTASKPDANGAGAASGKSARPARPAEAPPAPRLEAPAPDEPLLPSSSQSKMERYAARHGRGVSRGKPSAKGAKK